MVGGEGAAVAQLREVPGLEEGLIAYSEVSRLPSESRTVGGDVGEGG